ncbi:hypothetical protein AMTRI_Chr03g56660 [Amborella trichopoda]
MTTQSHLLNRMPSRNIISWNAMLSAYIHHGYIREAFSLFDTWKNTYYDSIKSEYMRSKAMSLFKILIIIIYISCFIDQTRNNYEYIKLTCKHTWRTA